MKYLALICLALASCGEPRLLNQGASLPVTAVSDHDMSVAAGEQSRTGWIVGGLYDGRQILLLDGGDRPYTLSHEIAHHRDRVGGTYADAIRAATPANPSPEMARKLAVCWEIEAKGGDPWQAIKDSFGESAVGHKEILGRLK